MSAFLLFGFVVAGATYARAAGPRSGRGMITKSPAAFGSRAPRIRARSAGPSIVGESTVRRRAVNRSAASALYAVSKT
ncbi:MAG TPA: hypothetical protein VIL43_08960 [Burkholderiales bacterium]